MTSAAESTDLTGKLLIAMPGMGDPRFDHSVIFICTHSPEGAMGLIVNKPASDLEFADLLKQLGIEKRPDVRPIAVNLGGPVENGRGFVLHSSDYGSESSTLAVGGDFGMTATLEILEDISRGDGPSSCFLAMGYSGWGPGQLEAEIQHNGWLICDASPELVFEGAAAGKWQAALATLGIDPLLLSSEGGHA
ncbi:MAG: YqgE/AlgH family protein [Litoreibacter sp.]|nr:YqgE/AlgH family protein [Litoreibacter sp.]